MAKETELVADLEEELVCAVCLSLFTEPRTLKCMHSYCTMCLIDIWKQSDNCVIDCPLCREPSSYPEGVLSIRKNTSLQSIVTKLKDNKRKISLASSQPTRIPASPERPKTNEFFSQYHSQIHQPPSPYAPSAPPIDEDELLHEVPSSRSPPDTHHSQNSPFRSHSPVEPLFLRPGNSPSVLGYLGRAVGIGEHSAPTINQIAQRMPSLRSLDEPSSSPPPPILTQPNRGRSPLLNEPEVILQTNSNSSTGDRQASNTIPSPRRESMDIVSPSEDDPEATDNEDNQRHPVRQSVDIMKYGKFEIKQSHLEKLFRKWCESLFFTPTKFVTHATLKRVKPTFIPFWLFKADIDVKYTGEALCDRMAPQVNTTLRTWVTHVGTRTATYKNVLVCGALESLSHIELLKDSIKDGDWDLDRIVSAQNTFEWVMDQITLFIGTRKEKFEDDKPPDIQPLSHKPLEESWDGQGMATIRDSELKQCTALVKKENNAQNVKNVNVHIELQQRQHMLVYLPVYIGSYTFESKDYLIVFNGQSGKIYAQWPVTTMGTIVRAGISTVSSIFSSFTSSSKANP